MITRLSYLFEWANYTITIVKLNSNHHNKLSYRYKLYFNNSIKDYTEVKDNCL